MIDYTKDFQIVGSMELPPDWYDGDVALELARTVLLDFNKSIPMSLIAVREPKVSPRIPGWHRDSEKLPQEGRPYFLLLWSNKYSTEVLLPDGSIVAAGEGEVAVINDTTCLHRSPEAVLKMTERDRWYVRCQIGPGKTKIQVFRDRNAED